VSFCTRRAYTPNEEDNTRKPRHTPEESPIPLRLLPREIRSFSRYSTPTEGPRQPKKGCYAFRPREINHLSRSNTPLFSPRRKKTLPTTSNQPPQLYSSPRQKKRSSGLRLRESTNLSRLNLLQRQIVRCCCSEIFSETPS